MNETRTTGYTLEERRMHYKKQTDECLRVWAQVAIWKRQAADYVSRLTFGELESELRRHGCVRVNDLIDAITRDLMQDDLA